MFRVAVLENQNKALIEELKSLKELYTGISWVDWLKYNSTYTSLENLKFKAVIKYDSFPGGKMMWDIINILWRYFSTKQGRRPNSMSTEMWQVISSERNRQCLKNLPLQTRSDLMYALSCGPYSRPLLALKHVEWFQAALKCGMPFSFSWNTGFAPPWTVMYLVYQ